MRNLNRWWATRKNDRFGCPPIETHWRRLIAPGTTTYAASLHRQPFSRFQFRKRFNGKNSNSQRLSAKLHFQQIRLCGYFISQSHKIWYTTHCSTLFIFFRLFLFHSFARFRFFLGFLYFFFVFGSTDPRFKTACAVFLVCRWWDELKLNGGAHQNPIRGKYRNWLDAG